MESATMKYKKSMIIIMLVIFLFSIAAASASDVNETAMASENSDQSNDLNSVQMSDSATHNTIESSEKIDTLNLNDNEEKLTAGNIWYVNSSAANGEGTLDNPFNNLKDTITASSDNDIIRIASGTYSGENNANLIIDKNLTLERYGDGEAVFDGSGSYGIWEIQAKSINMTGFTFQNGYGGNGGALLFKSELINSNINANFNNNYAVSSGGAIYFAEFLTNVNIIGNFTKNNARGTGYDGEGGGAICFFAELNHVNIIGNFTDNIAQSYAGANYFKSKITNVNIFGNYNNNTATGQNGGANWFSALLNVNIIGNYSNNKAYFGGANVFYEALENVNITGNYINNTATNFDGGANQFRESLKNVAITGDYSYNKARHGGANFFNDDALLNNVNITGNYCHNEAREDGGAIYLGNPSHVNIIGNYTNNTAKTIALYGGGGAIFVLKSPTELTIAANFYNNTAVSEGAAILFYNSMSNVDVTGNVINNKGKSVIYNWGTSNSIIHDSIFINNSKINVDGSGTIKIVNTWFGNNATNYDTAPGENRINFENWLFLNATVDSNIDDDSKITNITFKLSSYNSSGVSDYNNNLLNPINLTITATNGNIAATARLGETIQFTPTSGGTATVTATVENAIQTVEIPVKGDFDLLQDLVNNESLSVINLERNYTYNQFDTMTEGVVINRAITINGNGYTINANGKTRIFKITSDNVVLENITFVNGNTTSTGGAVYFSKSGGLINCNFTDNSATVNGGAVHFNETGTVSNCNFTGNNATVEGGAVYFSGTGTVANCNFTDNSARNGGAVWIYSGTVSNCNFTDNIATSQGGAVFATSDGGAVYFENSGNVTNCNFTDNSADYGGAIRYLNGEGNVKNCNFVSNTAFRWGGAIRFNVDSTVTNCNFTDNIAPIGGAINMGGGTVSNCNFINNTATGNGGAVRMTSGNVSNCNFTDNSAGYGGAIYFDYSSINAVTKCNFIGNNATEGSAIYFYSASSKTVSNSRFLNNRANAEELQVTKNENNITIIFKGHNNLLNAIYSRNDAEVTFINVTYWGAKGINNTGSSEIKPSKSKNESGQNITVGIVVNGILVLNEVKVTDENGMIVLPIKIESENYYIGARHDKDSYYTEAEKTISNNMKFSVNVTSQTANNRTVNITAKSDIYGNFMPGKLLFILPNSTQINATYAGNGTWWAVYTFDNAGDYNVNASYIGLDNVTINNATISIRFDASVDVNNKTLDLLIGDTFTVVATTTPEGLKVSFVPDDSGVYSIDENGNVIALRDGEGSILIKVGDDGIYAKNSTIVNVTVSKIPTNISVNTDSLDLFVGDEVVIVATLTPTDAGNVTFTSSDENLVLVEDNGNVIANGKGQANITVSFAGNDKYAAAVNKTISVTVSLNNANVTVDKDKLDLKVGESYTINATKHPDTILLDITYTSSNNSVASVDKNGIVTAVGEGTAVITVSVGDDEIYAKNSTNVTVRASKVPSEITASDVSTVYNTDKYLIVNLKDSNGKPINGVKVTVDLNGAKTYTTDSNGQVKVSTKGLAPKTYTAKITFNGNTNYAKSTKDVKVTVKKATPKITAKKKTFKKSVKTKKYTITLKDNTGKPIKNTKVTLKVKGKTYKAKTNSKGKATFKINKLNKKGTFKAVIKYKGNKYYKKLTKKVKIKVIVTFKTVSKGSKDKSTVKQIQQALKDKGYYLSYKGHYLKVDGKYNSCTVRSVKEFQHDKGLKVTGKVDEKTAVKLGIIN